MTTTTSAPHTIPTVSLRDMSDTEFTQRYGTDRFTASVITNRLHYVVEHMSTGFLREAFSPIIRDWYDFACTISGPPEQDYPMSVVSNSLVVFLGTMGDAVRNTVIEYGPENLRPGDVLIGNDPYRTGTHVNDVLFIYPVFRDDTIVSFVNIRAHQLDMGGTVPGGFSGTKNNKYEEGLTIPPVLLYRQGEPVRSTFSLIFDNSRFGDILLPDFKSIYQQLHLGARLIGENIDRYGSGAFLGTLQYAVDTSAERMREAIGRIPDGDYVGTGLVDADGLDETEEFRIKVTLIKRGENIEAELSGTSRQARTSINASMLDSKTAVGVAITMLLAPETPFTSGTWRNIDMACPPGSLLNCMPPEGASMMFWEITTTLVTAVFDALNPVLGERAVAGDYGSLNLHNATGVLDDGTPWATAAQCGGEHGPWGATSDGDGDSYTVLFMLNNLDPATEAIEHDVPVVLLRKEAATDTAGAGFHRGGAATLRDSLWLTDASAYSSPFRTKIPSGLGANGGDTGRLGAVWIFPAETANIRERGKLIPHSPEVYADTVPVGGMLDARTKELDPDGRYFYFASQPSWDTKAGAMFRYLTNGGGGWGTPFERDPERVLRDVRDGYVSVEGAARDYGVVVLGDPENDPEGITVDTAATRSLRA
ncbi:N-methylhydantoinase B [Pseudonocardia autotrophica]|uniref:Acetophenone carboxylase delta subunit n=3 Tax=Pseudonocardiaceae TaxID=2070 RepID=A0A1Y2MK98_PSEAH|nr:Acetophenone carboxylase delta subunit [Pseudonocardia autotrophica]TDN75410.1 N-methylhydantoinase B [Pseudonocardia autotrophica]BBF99368.1 5-oxoprolinase [Pseudonocardia autotrophica]GEC29359.1 5-oxoprolinase [Pseudonocardia saturnea]